MCLLTVLQACFAEIIYWEVRFAAARSEAGITCVFAYPAPGMFCRDNLLGGQVCDREVGG